jgi:hypothetical protein
VNGSFRPREAVVAVGSALVAGDELVVVAAVWLPGVVPEVPEPVPGDVLGLLELDWVGWVLGVDDLCVCECRPASGSTYCWSPAEPPPAATALAGAPAAIDAVSTRQPTYCFH